MSYVAPLYDIEVALARVAQCATDDDELTQSLVGIAQDLADYVRRHFEPDRWEDIGRSLVLASSYVGGLAVRCGMTEHVTAHNITAMITNVQAYAGEMIVRDCRSLTAGPAQ